MVGDWAGEFGGMQFTASDYLKNARRLRRRRPPRPDPQHARHARFRRQFPGRSRLAARRTVAAGSARAGKTCHGRKPTSTSSTRPRSGQQWGVKAVHGDACRAPTCRPRCILPMGRHGPAFLAYPNFKAFLGWNSAMVYSTTVAYFATRLAGAPQGEPRRRRHRAIAVDPADGASCRSCSIVTATISARPTANSAAPRAAR